MICLFMSAVLCMSKMCTLKKQKNNDWVECLGELDLGFAWSEIHEDFFNINCLYDLSYHSTSSWCIKKSFSREELQCNALPNCSFFNLIQHSNY